MRTDLIVDALLMARGTRGSLAGAIFHSDHGAQLPGRCQRAGRRQSGAARITEAVQGVAFSPDGRCSAP